MNEKYLKNGLFLKNQTNKIILFLTIIILPLGLMAQNAVKTAYEKRIEQIQKEAAKKLGYSTYNDFVAVMLFDGIADALDGCNSKNAKVAVWYGEEMEKAKKLKTAEEIRREKQEHEERMKKESLSAEKREKETQEQLKRRAYEATDKVKMGKEIIEDFENWQKKGEFEKTADWQERLKNNSLQKFHEICTKILQKLVNYNYQLSNKNELQVYNADAECFPVRLSFKTDYGVKGNSSYQEYLQTNYIVQVPVSMNDAERFKKNYESGCYRWSADIYDYTFVNNYLCPKKVIYQECEKGKHIADRFALDVPLQFILDVPLQNTTEIEFAFDDLGIENEYAKGAVFNTLKLKQIVEHTKQEEQEKQKKIFEEKRDAIYSQYANQEKYANFLPNKTTFDKECEGLELEKMIKKANELIDQMEKEYRVAYEKEKDDFLSKYIIPSIPKIYYSHYKDDYSRYGKEGMLNRVFSAVKEIVEHDAKMNKEWKKNGQYFENIFEFYKAYITPYHNSRDYKNIINEKKKK